MSSDALSWAFKVKRFRGSTFLALLAMADSANDQNDNEIWATQRTIADKAMIGRQACNAAIKELTEAGVLVLIEDRHAAGKSNRYTLNISLSSETTNVSSAATSHAGGPSAVDLKVKETQTEPSPSGERLAHLLASLMVVNGTKKPTVTATWIRDMDRVMRLDGHTETQVENMIRWSQAHHFWHTVIHSPKNLRKHYDQMKQQAVAKSPSPTGRVAPVTQSNNVLRDFAMGGSSATEGYGNGAGDIHGQLAAQGSRG